MSPHQTSPDLQRLAAEVGRELGVLRKHRLEPVAVCVNPDDLAMFEREFEAPPGGSATLWGVPVEGDPNVEPGEHVMKVRVP